MNKNYYGDYWLKNRNKQISYPAEAVIRIFKGKFPKLKFQFKKKQKILDVGFGDGRHIYFFKNLGLEVYGTEISENIVKIIKKKLKIRNLKVGTAQELPYKKNFFDILLGWNSIYYMGYQNYEPNFQNTPRELSRVIKKNGYIIISIPTDKCFIFNNSKVINNKYRIIKKDFFKLRNDEVMRCFSSEKEIKFEFKKHFKNFSFSKIKIDCFGLNYDWIVMIAQKK
jgi:ubiquinone/menaquinone biosynthesis C-methylase UbiE